MKILYVHDYDQPVGGAEVVMLRLRDCMRRRGHDAQLFASLAENDPAGVERADFPCFGTKSRWRGLVQAFNPMAAVSLRRVLREFRPDVVHVGMFLTQLSPLILPLLRQAPSLYHAMWYRAVCPTGTKMLPDGQPCGSKAGLPCLARGCVSKLDFLPRIAQLGLTRQWIDAFDAIVPVSESVRAELQRAGIACHEVIPLSVEESPRTRTRRDGTLIGFAGRLVKEKGVDVLLRAFSLVLGSVPAARLLIIGDGPHRESLSSLASQLGLTGRVEFAGHLSRTQAEHRLSPAIVQVACSRWAEPFGLVAVEAMFRATAVVASDIGGLKDIVSHERTGLLVPAGDIKALAGALLRLLASPEDASAMGERGYARAQEQYCEPLALDRFQSLYIELIEARRRRLETISGNNLVQRVGDNPGSARAL